MIGWEFIIKAKVRSSQAGARRSPSGRSRGTTPGRCLGLVIRFYGTGLVLQR